MPLVNPSYQYVWLIWASAFLLPWAACFLARPGLRQPMLSASTLTAPFGLTEPLFVPAYWNPPSLFDLAQRTGFDVESLIFCFAIGGLGVASYRAVIPRPMKPLIHLARASSRHHWHLLLLASPILVFTGLLVLRWNPIYPAILAMAAGSFATILCWPDLWRNALFGGVIFLVLYSIFMLGLKWFWPGYIESVWNLEELTAWGLSGIPLEELIFGFTFGTYWSTVYEHLSWQQ